MLDTSEAKFVHVWFEFLPSYRSRKKGTEGKFFEAEAVGRSWKMFLKFPFFYWGNLAKTQIRRGQILPKEVSSTNIETECFFHFSGFFVKFHSIEVIAINSKIKVLWNANLQWCWGQGISQILQFNQWQSWNNDFIII